MCVIISVGRVSKYIAASRYESWQFVLFLVHSSLLLLSPLHSTHKKPSCGSKIDVDRLDAEQLCMAAQLREGELICVDPDVGAI